MLDNEKFRDYEREKCKKYLCYHKLDLHTGQQMLLEYIWGVVWNGVLWK